MNYIKSFLVVFFLWAVVSGCAGSKPEADATGYDNADGQYDEIEQLLGITPEDKTTAQPAQAEDDDLLTLLQQSENSAATEPVVPTEPQENQKAVQLEEELNDLQKQLRDKNKTINNLKEQVKVLEDGQSQAPGSGFSAVAAQPGISDAEYERTYNDAYQLAHQRKFRDAVRVFESLIAANPHHSLADNAQYWIGESYYGLGDYRAAIVAFEKVFTFKKSNKNDYAQYKLGLCYFQLKELAEARREFQKLIDNHPNSANLISKAEQYIARM